MTRVNLVKVENLADQHLFAEFRELKMVPAALRRSLKTKSINEVLANIPRKYTLNKGHVLFFMNKMQFLHNRYKDIAKELVNRDYNIQGHNAADLFLNSVPSEFRQVTWTPNVDEIKVNVERIVLRLNERPGWYRYYGNIMHPSYFSALYEIETGSVELCA